MYTDRVSALANIPDCVLFASKHIVSPLTAMHRLIGHVLGLLLKVRPSEFLHRGRRDFPTLWENVLCLNLRIAEISFSWISSDFRINLDEEGRKRPRNISTITTYDVTKTEIRELSKNKQFPAFCTATAVQLPLLPCQPADSGRQQTG